MILAAPMPIPLLRNLTEIILNFRNGMRLKLKQGLTAPAHVIYNSRVLQDAEMLGDYLAREF